jgi:hypothetical protein
MDLSCPDLPCMQALQSVFDLFFVMYGSLEPKVSQVNELSEV